MTKKKRTAKELIAQWRIKKDGSLYRKWVVIPQERHKDADATAPEKK